MNMPLEYSFLVNQYGFISAYPLPSEAELSEFYRDVYFEEKVSHTYSARYDDVELEHKKLRASATIEFIRQNIDPTATKRFLDIGCGEGFLLDAALTAGWDIAGVDFSIDQMKRLNPELSDFAKAISPMDYLDLCINDGKKFDIIALQNVIEHVIDPSLLMKKVKSILSENGILFAQIPNDFSDLQTLIFDMNFTDKKYWVSPPQHLHYFNDKNFETFVTAMEFRIVDSMGDFPIELFLLTGKDNYANNKERGPTAHRSRLHLDLFFVKRGLAEYVDLYRAMYASGITRNILVVMNHQ